MNSVTYDIESLECTENLTENCVEAIHRVVSIALSSNQGHSWCFVRQNSEHSAVQVMIQEFLDALDIINDEYEAQTPDFFREGLEHLELMCSDASTLPKGEKMILRSLGKQLEKYMLLDVYGFNSGK